MIRLVTTAIAILTVVFFAAAAQAASNTHIGQKASQMVTLEVVGAVGVCSAMPTAFLPLEFVRNRADGTVDPYPPSAATPPAGKVLVITDVDWQWAGGPADSTAILRLWRVNLADPGIDHRVFESAVHLDGSGAGGISEGATAGFVVSSAATICVDALGTGSLQHLILHGYLAPDA